MKIGDRIRELRKEDDLSREDLAQKLNLSYSAIAKYESGYRVPDDDTKRNISKYFNVSLDYLMGLSDIKNPYEEKNIDVDEFLKELAKGAKERGIKFDSESPADLLDFYEFIKNRK